MTIADDGRAYGRPAGTWDPELVEVGPGTPAGELLRRYWHPIARSGRRTALSEYWKNTVTLIFALPRNTGVCSLI